MSAKAFYHKSPPCIPALNDVPPEIWSTIIRYAADSGSGLYDYEMTPSEHADFLRGEEKAQMRVHHAIFRARSYLARVNKAWYEMAAPFLFEYISLRNGRKVLPLSKALLRSEENSAANRSECTLGWWTKRLDVHMREPNPNVSETIIQIASMVSCFPNLRILTFSANGHGYVNLASSRILNAVSTNESLKAIHWYTRCIWPFTDDWTAFLESHSGLQSIRGPADVESKNKVALKSLKALHPDPPTHRYGPTFMGLASLDLPNLRCFGWTEAQHLEDELQRIGDHLSVLQIHTYLDVDMCRTMSSIIRNHCSNLVQINLDISSTPPDYVYPVIFLGINSLKTLGLRFTWFHDQISTREMRTLIRHQLPLVISNNASITTIQFLGIKNIRSLRQHPKLLKEGMERFVSRGVALKDHEGRPLLELANTVVL